MYEFWKTVQWEPFYEQHYEDVVIRHDRLGWTKRHVPYVTHGNSLQTVDIWVPLRDKDTTAPASNALFNDKDVWIIYVHGGAWRDPSITSESFLPTIRHLLRNKSAMTRVAGIASINYSLSPYPDHATHPSPSDDSSGGIDPSRTAKHPDHIRDVLQCISFLQSIAGFGSNYVLVGHSCGATLALQTVMNRGRWGFGPDSSPKKAQCVVGLNGLYNLPVLAHNPGSDYTKVAPVYKAFLTSAFGKDEGQWLDASPSVVQDWQREWPKGVRIVLAQSTADSLVPYEQTSSMLSLLRSSSSASLQVLENHISGEHNHVWKDGARLADMIIEQLQFFQ